MTSKQLSDDNREDQVQGRIMYEFVLKVDTFKTMSQRKSPKVLDMLKSIGGIYSVSSVIFKFLGMSISKAFYQSNAGSHLFIEKKPSLGTASRINRESEIYYSSLTYKERKAKVKDMF